MIDPNHPVSKLVKAVAVELHGDRYFEGAKLVAKWLSEVTKCSVPRIDSKKEADAVLTTMLQWLLSNNGYEEAAELLWGRSLFDPRPESARRVWRSFENHNFILLMGAGSMSKSYSMGVRLMLEWIRDPQYTTIKVLGPSEEHLESNLFTHLVTLHRNATIPLPGEIGKLFIGLDPRERKSSITGVVIPLGKKAAGRLQGVKRINRKKPHPEFGPLSRMFVFLDEIANIPTGIWRDIDNVLASSSESGIKIIGAFNPTDQMDEVGKRCEPAKTWQMFDPDSEEDLEWTSPRGWRVVRLDAARCENVVQRKTVFPGLQTYEGFQMVIRNSGGVESPGYWSMARGCFPPTGTPLSIIPPGLLSELKAEFIWLETPTPCGAVDLALQGNDVAVYTKGSFGLATGVKLPPTIAYPDGRTVMFKNPEGRNSPRYALQADAQFKLPKGDTVAIKDEIIRISRQLGVRAEWLCVDSTGNGQGVYDLLRFEYGEAIGLNFSQSASDTKVFVEDHDCAKELYDRAHSELWFAARKFIEFGLFKLMPGFPTDELYPQLTGRRYRMAGKRARVESKDAYQSRNQSRSPDEADSIMLLIHCARKASGVSFAMKSENTIGKDDSDEYVYELGNWKHGVRIDVTNKFEDL